MPQNTDQTEWLKMSHWPRANTTGHGNCVPESYFNAPNTKLLRNQSSVKLNWGQRSDWVITAKPCQFWQTHLPIGKSKPVTESDTVTQETLEKKQTCGVVWIRCHLAYSQHIIFFNIIVDHNSPGPLLICLFCYTWPDVIHPAASWPPAVGQWKSCSLF